MIAAAINVNPREFFALGRSTCSSPMKRPRGRRVMAKIAEAFPEAFVLGVTATPERLDGRGLCDAFDGMVVGPASPIS
jgi:hypothetical protein